MGDVISGHSRLVDKWADRYIALYKTKGSDVAKKWAVEFLQPPERQLMIDRVNSMLHKK